jgi:hypothetical protein
LGVCTISSAYLPSSDFMAIIEKAILRNLAFLLTHLHI